jgi:hypothetical protein
MENMVILPLICAFCAIIHAKLVKVLAQISAKSVQMATSEENHFVWQSVKKENSKSKVLVTLVIKSV